MHPAKAKFSVVIPAYNAAGTLRECLDCVLGQTVPAHEVLVLDDGSTDETPEILASYAHEPRVRAFRRPNGGLAAARNFLCQKATGDHVVCIDADDLWHPRFLEAQQRMIATFPQAVASFTHHIDFLESKEPVWEEDDGTAPGSRAELIEPLAFMRRINQAPMTFHISCFCIPVSVLEQMGDEPFYVPASGADDTFILNRLALFGPVAATPERFGGYRIREGSISSNQLRMALLVLRAFDGLAPLVEAHGDRELSRLFDEIRAQRQRHCGKFLMGAAQPTDGRRQFIDSLSVSTAPKSLGKSFGLLVLSLLPRTFQPNWPSVERTA
jgi:glycosyltransferase involved in cell wall biosynthesis